MSPIVLHIDWTALGDIIVNALVAGLRALFSPLPVAFEEWLLHSIQQILGAEGGSNLLTHIPVEWTSQNAEVLGLWRAGLLVETALAALVLTIQGFRVVNGKVDIWEAVLRTGFFVIAGEAMALWADLILHAINAGSDAIGQVPLDIRSEALPNDLTLGLMLILAAFFAVLAWLKGAVGVLFIDVLIVAAPYLLTLSALPLLEGLGKWWVEEFTTWALRPFMVALVLRLGLGLGIVNVGGLQLLFAIVSFWLAWTMDTRIRRFSVGAWGSVGQLGVFSRGAAFAASAFSGGTAAAAPAAAPAPAAATP